MRPATGRAWFALLAIVLASCASPRGPAPAAKDPADRIREVSVEELRSWTAAGRKFVLIDVREDEEWKSGHVPAALHVPRWTLSRRIAGLVPDRAACIVLYCKGGVRSAGSAATLQMLGYTNVFSLAGGLKAYRAAGMPVQP